MALPSRPRNAKAADCSNGLAIAALLEGRPEHARPLFEDALDTFEEMRNTYWVGLTQLMLSQVERQQGELDAAVERIRAGLSAFRELESVMGIGWALYSFADVAVHRKQHERALRLVGASDALLEEVGEMPALATATMGDVGAAARANVDEATAERVYQEGSAMALEDVVAYALQEGG